MQGKKPRNPEKIRNVNENAEGRTGSWWRIECELAGRNKAGMRGMCGPFGGGWTQEKQFGYSFHSEPSSGL